MTKGQFIASAKAPPPHEGFTAVLGRMLLANQEIDQNTFNAVGDIQARTVILAETFDQGSADQRKAILDKFGGKDWKTKEPTGKLDLNGAIFGMKLDSAVQDLDHFIASLGIEELDIKMKAALEAVGKEKGVHPDAAASGVIIKALVLTDLNRDAKQDMVNASLIMQMSMRALGRVEKFLAGAYNRAEALELQNTASKLNYKFDPETLVDVNESLLWICATEMRVDSALQKDPDSIHRMRRRYESAVKDEIPVLIDAMQAASKMYETLGKDKLSKKAAEVFKYYTERYKAVLETPHLMLSADEAAKIHGPSPDDMIN